MKKLLFCLVVLVSLTGCDKALKCTSSVENSAMEIKKTYKVYSDEGVVTKVKANIIYEIVDDNLNSDFDTMAVLLKSDYEAKQIPFEYKNKGNKYIFDVTYDVDTLSKENFDEFIGTKSLEEYKQKLIDQDFKCK